MEQKTLAQRTLEIALSQQGVSEQPKGTNTGPQVNEYLKSAGISPGYPWCMAFVYWCVSRACEEFKIVNPLVRTGGVMNQWNQTKLRKIPRISRSVKPGDVFIMQFGHGTGHTGFVEKIEGGLIYTIEGNTNDDGSREGYEVARRTRPISSFIGFIQLT
jgi:hypothetical protein